MDCGRRAARSKVLFLLVTHLLFPAHKIRWFAL